uniref:Uncharacterized protein n=1 Tax=Anas zonorhyncha TaxID=75864 RepID=A0A8B9URJ2_9AVES
MIYQKLPSSTCKVMVQIKRVLTIAFLMSVSMYRRAQLADSFHLQQFFRDSDELKSWVNEKMKTATDEAYKDPSNLQGKVQKHQAFEAELSANQSRIDALEKAGQKLIDVNHYASDEVAARMNEVISLWKKLLEATELKGKTYL